MLGALLEVVDNFLILLNDFFDDVLDALLDVLLGALLEVVDNFLILLNDFFDDVLDFLLDVLLGALLEVVDNFLILLNDFFDDVLDVLLDDFLDDFFDFFLDDFLDVVDNLSILLDVDDTVDGVIEDELGESAGILSLSVVSTFIGVLSPSPPKIDFNPNSDKIEKYLFSTRFSS